MGLSKYQIACNILKDYIEKTGKKYLHTNRLRNLIIREIGGDENRTIVPTLKMMREQGIIEEVGIHKWEIHIT